MAALARCAAVTTRCWSACATKKAACSSARARASADDCHAVWRAVAGRGEAYDRDGLLGWCRDPPGLKDGATDDEAPASPGAE